jgi:hypothetical protein
MLWRQPVLQKVLQVQVHQQPRDHHAPQLTWEQHGHPQQQRGHLRLQQRGQLLAHANRRLALQLHQL